MINVEKTLFNTIRERIDRMRFLAELSPEAFKKIMYVVILKDLLEWAKFIGDNMCTYNTLSKKIDEFILRNPEFNIERTLNTQNYTNVNTPQTIFTWQRLWDNPAIIYSKDISQTEKSYAYTPDSSCTIELVYFDLLNEDGEPDIDRSKLTVCEKMNIYIDRNTGILWYIGEDGNWETIKSETLVDWSNVLNAPTIYSGVKHNLTDHNTVKVVLDESDIQENEDINLVKIEEVEDLL